MNTQKDTQKIYLMFLLLSITVLWGVNRGAVAISNKTTPNSEIRTTLYQEIEKTIEDCPKLKVEFILTLTDDGITTKKEYQHYLRETMKQCNGKGSL